MRYSTIPIPYQTITKKLRKHLIGTNQNFTFTPYEEKPLPQLKNYNLYIHIPFCKTLCPYCPYNRTMYDKNLVEPYLKAMLQEIEDYSVKLGHATLSSIYIGGGTPTTLIDELAIILQKLHQKFTITGDICIETTPLDLYKENLKKLKAMGITLISIGVQSFQDNLLNAIGRKHSAKQAEKALEETLDEGVNSTNIDLMFVLPGQTEAELYADLEKTIELHVDQVTTYPLFTFPYTTVGEYLRLNKIKMPSLIKRRKMYKMIYNFYNFNDYHPVSVWGFKQKNATKYSSVTRDHYIGLGAGAASRFPSIFYFNTFSVHEYIKSLLNKKTPIAISMEISSALNRFYWLYWRFYETSINKDALFSFFGENNRKISLLLKSLKLLWFIKETEKTIHLTERGAFYIHLLQNYFVLDYINNVWSVAMKEPWPKSIEI